MIFLGVDQTGAINSKKEPRPLPACLLRDDEPFFFYLKKFSAAQIGMNISHDEMGALQVALDCVLGIPKEINFSWRQAIHLTLDYEGFGRAPAKAYFAHLGKGQVPRREVEILCKANSVFQEMPFQRNIQTGTFRLWKDIAESGDDFYAPLLEKTPRHPAIPIYEGYPSLGWKQLLKTKTRKPQELIQFLKKGKLKLKWSQYHQQQIKKDPNLADALILALSLKKNIEVLKARKPDPEGWIIGADELVGS